LRRASTAGFKFEVYALPSMVSRDEEMPLRGCSGAHHQRMSGLENVSNLIYRILATASPSEVYTDRLKSPGEPV
jgi:hypothetical protein